MNRIGKLRSYVVRDQNNDETAGRAALQRAAKGLEHTINAALDFGRAGWKSSNAAYEGWTPPGVILSTLRPLALHPVPTLNALAARACSICA